MARRAMHGLLPHLPRLTLPEAVPSRVERTRRSRTWFVAGALFVAMAACSKSFKKSQPKPAPAESTLRLPSSGKPAATRVAPRSAASVGTPAEGRADAGDAPTPTLEPETFNPPERSKCADCSYTELLKASRQRAEELGAGRVRSLVVEKGSVSVERYRNAEEGVEQNTLHVVAAGFDPWEFQGYEDTRAEHVELPAGTTGPALFELYLSQCPGGFCVAGCSPFRSGVALLFMAERGVVSLVPRGNVADRGKVADLDHDGTPEFEYPWPDLPFGTCGGAWCCPVNQGPYITRYVGWDGRQWSEALSRFRPLYEAQRQTARERLGELRGRDRSDRKVRCELTTHATRLFWLAQLLGEPRARLRGQLDEDLRGFEPRDCFPVATPNEPDLASLQIPREEVIGNIVRLAVPELF